MAVRKPTPPALRQFVDPQLVNLSVPQTTITVTQATLTDNSGGATADGTIGAVTAPTALTHSFGTADNTVDDVGGAFNQTTLNNNFKELTTAQAANRAAIVALTDAIKELSTQINAAKVDIGALKTLLTNAGVST